ncbi:XRE family transcriptional regulator [Spartinivicinus ruber]|uniref:XRE family transcriptional regulator n=1 Tax=Spartinivicinus ruber TaxID=2683272 RepID=UPI0013D5B6DE|nr:S24 family peptidase [Spartinivicinus ruber]
MSSTAIAMPSTLEQRIRYVQDKVGTLELSKLSGISTSQLNRYSAGHSKPTVKRIEQIATAAQINAHWLLTGEGSANHDQLPFVSSTLCFIDDVKGHPHDDMAFSTTLLYALKASNDDLVRFDVPDDAMSPTLHPEDTVLATKKFSKSNGLFLLEANGVVMIRRLAYEIDGSIELITDNSAYKNVELHPDQHQQINLIAKVIWRSGKL